MKPWLWLAGGSGLYAMALAAFAPASLLDAMLADASNGRFRLASAEGTMWSGQAITELRDAAALTRWAAPVAWRLRPAALLAGRLEYRLSTRPPASLSGVSLSWSRVELTGVDIRLPAAALASGVPALAPWGMGGELQLVADRLDFGPAHAGGSATMHWRSADSALAPVSPLGDYELQFEGRDQAWLARLRTITGPLQLSGEGRWRPGDPPAFEASMIVPPENRQVLSPFLRLIAVERSDGSFDWRLR
ncbi:MAG: hypothetical protein DCF27_12315 [Lysobacteraceae bacterium]|nr:MAG: hypothetical protein DCF27_12315 [Xanthomonadaceae bacterium]